MNHIRKNQFKISLILLITLVLFVLSAIVPGWVRAANSGDVNNNGKIDISDYNIITANFGHPYTIFDYNTLVENFGSSQIRSGIAWNDTNGNVIEAHAGGFIKVGSIYWWCGIKTDVSGAFVALPCYSSSDLTTWHFEFFAFQEGQTARCGSSCADLGPNRAVERPHILYNPVNNNYVMWLHIDALPRLYVKWNFGVATAPAITGPWTYIGNNIGVNDGDTDINLYQEGNSAYLVHENDARGDGILIDRLSDDYLSVAQNIIFIPTVQHSAPVLTKIGGLYYLFSNSTHTGYGNHTPYYATAPALSGPWTTDKPLVAATSIPITAQSTDVIKVTGSQTTTYIWVADNWINKQPPGSNFVFLPLVLDTTSASASVTWNDNWSIDTESGTWRSN